jgi:hypothetical protein
MSTSGRRIMMGEVVLLHALNLLVIELYHKVL